MMVRKISGIFVGEFLHSHEKWEKKPLASSTLRNYMILNKILEGERADGRSLFYQQNHPRIVHLSLTIIMTLMLLMIRATDTTVILK